jgi:hypothetical protein
MAGNSTTFLHPRKGPAPEPAEKVSHDSHGLGDAARGHAHPDIARDGAPKRVEKVLVHGGMTRRQMAGFAMGHANATAPDANPASPLSKEPQGKNFAPVRAVPGQRSRTSQHNPALGAAILASAQKN